MVLLLSCVSFKNVISTKGSRHVVTLFFTLKIGTILSGSIITKERVNVKDHLFFYRNYLQGLFFLLAYVCLFPEYSLHGSQRDILATVGGVVSLVLSAILYIRVVSHREDISGTRTKKAPVSKRRYKLIFLEGGEL
jgi:hypothetical protein